MLCDNCKQKQATVHTVTIINGVKQEHYLCADCAQGAQFSLPSLMDILSGFHVAPQQVSQCECSCGNGFEYFQKTGLLGCPECYTAYRNLLVPVIKRAQGGKVHHVGRRPPQMKNEILESQKIEEKAAEKPRDERERLQAELIKAVQEERYERAAELRDRLRALDGGECS